MAYGTPSDPVGGTVITVAYAVSNILDPIRWLRLMTGNSDPPGTGYMVTADSPTTTSWKTGVAAILHVLGYTPANKAGETFAGNVVAGGVVNSGTSMSVGTTLTVGTNGTVNGTWTVGSALAALSAAITNALTAASVTATGDINSGANVSAATITTSGNVGVGGVVSATDHTIGGTSVKARSSHTGTQLAATISDLASAVSGMAAASATTATNAANAALLDSLDSTQFARLAAASDFTTAPTINGAAVGRIAATTFSGNGSDGRTIALAFTPVFVWLHSDSGSGFGWFIDATGCMRIAGGTNVISEENPTITTNGFIVNSTGGSNSNLVTYRYVALGFS